MADRERWKRGQALTRRRLNRTVEELERGNFVQGGAGALVSHQGGKTVHEAQRRGATLSSGGGGRTAKVVSVSADHLSCTFYDEPTDTDGPSVLVAKPRQLRKTGIDGQTIAYIGGPTVSYVYTGSPQYLSRTATVATFTETQVVTPPYYVGEILDIDPKPTGLVVSGSNVNWVDMNTGTKVWGALR